MSGESQVGIPSLTGRVAVVVGGSSGLGEAIAVGFGQAGADVVVASRKLDQCEAAADKVAAAGGNRAVAREFHVGRWDQCADLVDGVVSELGRIDVLVNSAGLSIGYDSLADIDERHWDAVFGVNVKGPFRLCVLAGDHMRRTGGGSIVNIGSTASKRPRGDLLPYSAAKAALDAMTTALVHELAPEVRINTIVPGPFHTRMTSGWSEREVAERGQQLAMGRMGMPDEVVGAALFLASDEASSFVSGAEIRVDGGRPR